MCQHPMHQTAVTDRLSIQSPLVNGNIYAEMATVRKYPKYGLVCDVCYRHYIATK